MKGVLVKVYAAFHPAGQGCPARVERAAANALGNDDWLFMEGDMLRISFEGVFFPLDDVLSALEACLEPHSAGKLDYLDLEAWSLTRCLFQPGAQGGTFERSVRSLNHILDYSGH